VDAVVHLAARVHVMRETSADALAAYRAVNVGATERLARMAAQLGAIRIVYASSIKVNGESTAQEQFRPDDEPRPLDPYGVSKWEAERALWEIAATTPLEIVVVRPPLVYGPEVGGNFLRLLRLVSSGVPLPLARVRNRRSMIYVGNLSSALIACATQARAAGETYLVCDGEDLSTAELVIRLAHALRCRARLVPVPPSWLRLAGAIAGKADEVGRLIGSLTVDGSRLRSTLGWTPPHSVDAGLRETARWFSDSTRAT
jgi:nucleoside-diphosphate-sugar epimerase